MEITILTYLILVNYIFAENSCKIKMSNSKMSVFKANDELIFNEGVLNPKWSETAASPYMANTDTDMEYFYILETALADAKNHDEIVNLY
jgi:hypothetical protein